MNDTNVSSQKLVESHVLRVSPRLYLVLITGAAALGGLLFGYDTAVISGAIGLLQTYFALTPSLTGWAASSALAGCIVGAGAAGWTSDRFGRHRTLVIAGGCFLVSALGTAAAGSFTIFILFRIVGGLGIGAASVASPLYIGESAPARWRGALVGLNQLAIVCGMLIVYLVNYRIHLSGTLQWNQTTGWRWMFASGIVPSALLLGLLFFVPETARFLLMRGRRAEAEVVAARTGTDTFEEIVKADRQGSVSRTHRRRALTVGLMLAFLQQVTGINVFLYYAPTIFERVSHSGNTSLRETVVMGAVNVIFTVLAMLFVDRAGRKPLLIAGCVGMTACLLATGLTLMEGGSFHWLLFYVLAYIACFAFSVGPVTWIVLAEIFPSRDRATAMARSTTALWIANFVVSQTFPMIDNSAFLIARFGHGFPFFLYAVFCVLEIGIVWRLLPETKNRTLEEIAAWWEISGSDAGRS